MCTVREPAHNRWAARRPRHMNRGKLRCRGYSGHDGAWPSNEDTAGIVPYNTDRGRRPRLQRHDRDRCAVGTDSARVEDSVSDTTPAWEKEYQDAGGSLRLQ